MPLTFEERISEELDALFSGAMFLSGGRESSAQELLIQTVRLASSEYSDRVNPEGFTSWMEGLLVHAALGSASAHAEGARERKDDPGHSNVAPDALERIGRPDILRAASSVPKRPRVALWLVLLRRWSYDDAAAALGVEKDALHGLLAYRADFYDELVGGSSSVKSRDTGS